MDKSAASDCEIVAIVDATGVLHEFALWCAEYVLALVGDPAPYSVAAVATKRAWLRGEVSSVELDYARDAARMAALDEGTRAAKDAAWSATGATLEDALEAANAASASALNAIYAADRTLSDGSANDAGYCVTREAQNAKLEEMLSALLDEAGFHGNDR